MKLRNIIEQISQDIEQKIDKVKLKNPKTGRQNKLMTAVSNKDNPNHSKAIKMLQNLKGKKETTKEDLEYYDKVIGVLKVIGNDKGKIKKRLDKTKTKKEFKNEFIKSIDPKRAVVDDKTLDILYNAYMKNKNEKISKDYNDDDFEDFKFNKNKRKHKSTKKSSSKDYNDDDYENVDSENEDEIDEDIKDLDKSNLIGLISVAGLFGGVGKLFQFSSNATIKYLEKFKDAFIDKKDKIKDIFNGY